MQPVLSVNASPFLSFVLFAGACLTQHAVPNLQKCGDIRTLYSACKHQGFVLISYFDGRAGNYAKAALDGVLMNGRPLQIEPSAPGQKVHDKDTQSGEGTDCHGQLATQPLCCGHAGLHVRLPSFYQSVRPLSSSVSRAYCQKTGWGLGTGI